MLLMRGKYQKQSVFCCSERFLTHHASVSCTFMYSAHPSKTTSLWAWYVLHLLGRPRDKFHWPVLRNKQFCQLWRSRSPNSCGFQSFAFLFKFSLSSPPIPAMPSCPLCPLGARGHLHTVCWPRAPRSGTETLCTFSSARH